MAAYRYDPDLEFLGTLSSQELDDLVHLLIYDKDDSPRYTEMLTMNDDYKKYCPDHHQYWQAIATELQHFGGNTFMNLFRNGRGVLYKEILCDVCNKLKVNYSSNSSTRQIEQNLLLKILQDALENMSQQEIETMARELGIEESTLISGSTINAAMISIFRAGGFTSYKILVTVVNAVLKALIGRGLTIGGNTILTKIAAIWVGPIGWAITALWSLSDISGTAFRVTIPAVIQVAYLRFLSDNRDCILEGNNLMPSVSQDTEDNSLFENTTKTEPVLARVVETNPFKRFFF